jgi:hypothetical protein
MKRLSIEERSNLVIEQCKETIKCQENYMRLAEKREDDTKWLHHYEMKELCQNIIDMLNGDYDLDC